MRLSYFQQLHPQPELPDLFNELEVLLTSFLFLFFEFLLSFLENLLHLFGVDVAVMQF